MATKKAKPQQTVSAKDLSPADRRALLAELKNELKAEEAKVQTKRKGYKEKVNKKLPGLFQVLKEASGILASAKKKVYKELQELVKEKSLVYDREQDQFSHTFSSDEGISITIGHRMLDGYDDTAAVGLQKINDFLESLGKDENSRRLVRTIKKLAEKDSSGNLKPSKVLLLRQLADETKSKLFRDGVQIVQAAYRPTRSKQFVTCRYKGPDGATIELPLSISDVKMEK